MSYSVRKPDKLEIQEGVSLKGKHRVGYSTRGGNNMVGKYEIYKDKSGKFRWRLTRVSGRVITRSGENYTTKVNAVKGLWGALAATNSR
jgi:uncharacterized protein YegP (UPF0339 family)